MPGKGGGREVMATGGWGAVEWPGSKEDGAVTQIKTHNPLTAVAVQVIESLRARHRVEGRSGAVAVGLSLETGSCEVNHVVCGEWGWYKGPGSSPPMQRGDVITSVDGEIVMPSDVGQRMHAGPLGSKVQVRGLRGNNHTKVEATLVRQDGLIIDGLVHVEEALDEVKRAAMALGGRPGSVLEYRMVVLERQVAKLGSACAKQESSLSERGAVYQSHIKELEESIIRLAQGDTDADDEAGKAAVAELCSKDALVRQIQQLESELSVRESIANELAEMKSSLRETEVRVDPVFRMSNEQLFRRRAVMMKYYHHTDNHSAYTRSIKTQDNHQLPLILSYLRRNAKCRVLWLKLKNATPSARVARVARLTA